MINDIKYRIGVGTTSAITLVSGTNINYLNFEAYACVDLQTIPKLLSKAEINKNNRIEREKLNSKTRKNSRWC